MNKLNLFPVFFLLNVKKHYEEHENFTKKTLPILFCYHLKRNNKKFHAHLVIIIIFYDELVFSNLNNLVTFQVHIH